MSLQLGPGEVLEDLSLTELSYEISTWIAEAARLAGSQMALGTEVLGCSQATVSKLATRRQALVLDKARLLDAWWSDCGDAVPLPHSFEKLARAYEFAKKRDESRPLDVFVAFPMSSSDDYVKDRKRARRLVTELRAHGLKVYWAGDDIAKRERFDTNELAYRKNLTQIRSSRLFVLYLPRSPRPDLDRPSTPSSIWIELGMALARNMPSTIFAPEQDDVPFIVRRALEDADTRGKIVDTVFFGSDANLPVEQIRNNGKHALIGGSLL